MSVKFYGKMWIATAEDLKNVILKEKVIQKLSPTRDRLEAHRIFASLYARYVILCNNLGDIYDQTCQVQKRKIVQKLLEAATQRLVEMHSKLKEIEMSEFIYIDQQLIEEKLIPNDIQLLRPFYYPLKRPIEIQNLIDGIIEEEQIDRTINNNGNKKETIEMKKIRLLQEEQKKQNTPEAIREKILIEAINLIKRHERARQNRCLFTNIKMHPEKYLPQPQPDVNTNPYVFYHKDDQTMLIPVKKTIYNNDFHQSLISFSQIKYYEHPSRKNEKQTIMDQLPSDDNIQPSSESLVKINDINDNESIINSTLIVKISESQLQLATLQNNAANKIQRYWLRYKLKKLIHKRQLKRMLCLGMIDEQKWNFSAEREIEMLRNSHRNKKEQFDREFIQACQDTKAKILKLKSPWIMEDISDHIRNWFHEMYQAGGELDKYPPEMKGGTILVIRGQTKTPEEFTEFIKKRELNKNQNDEQKKQEAEAKLAKKEAAKIKRLFEKEKLRQLMEQKKKQEEKYGKFYEFTEKDFITKAYIKLEQTMEEYEKEWAFIDEMHNVKEKPYMEWIELDKYAECHMELRKTVDELMRIEYEQLRMELCKDIKKPYKPERQPKSRGRKNNRRRRHRGAKSQTADVDDRSIPTIYDEMLKSGLIMKSYPKLKLDNFIGDLNFAAYELRNYYQKNPLPELGEMKNILRHWLLGMGPLKQPQKKTRSICIAGPPKCGKKYLAYAMANEIDAVMFNLNSTIVSKYKSDLNGFIKLLQKMAKLLQPTVLFIDGAHEPFIKKITKSNDFLNDNQNHDDPRILGKYLFKIIKSIKPMDKILLIGTTNEPWNCTMGQMKRCYECNILCNSDYGTALRTWQTGIFQKYGTDRCMDLSALSKVTKMYTTGQILNAIDKVLTIKRRVRLPIEPLTNEELLNGLLTNTNGMTPHNFPLSEQEIQRYQKWFLQINKLAKQRSNYMKKLQDEKEKKSKKK